MGQMVKDLMVPISEYATVNKGASIFEAVLVLEKAQEKYNKSKYKHRALLVLDNNDKVIGKLSQLDILGALEQENNQKNKFENIGKFGFGKKFIANQMEQSRIKSTSLHEICLKPAKMKVETFMKVPSDYQYINEETSLEVAIYQMLSGPYLSLMVVREDNVIGILKLTDIFLAIVQAMKENDSKNN